MTDRYKQRITSDTSMRLTQCNDCGCAVTDEAMHDAFHKRLDETSRRARGFIITAAGPGGET